MRKIITLTLCGLLLTSPSADVFAADPPASQPAKAAKPTGLARCRFELREARLSEDVGDLVISANDVVAEMLGVTPDVAEKFVTVVGEGDRRFMLAVVLSPQDVAPDRMIADKVLRKILELVEGGLAERQLEIEGMSGTESNADKINLRLKRAKDSIAQTEAAILEKIGGDLPVDVVRGSAPKVYNEREGLKLQQLGKQARQQALAQAIGRLAKAAETRATDDPVATELLKVVEARTKELQHLIELQKSGNTPATEVSRAESAVAEARAKMLERQEAVKQANGGDLLSNLNRELAALSVDAAEGEAKLAYIEGVLRKQAEIRPLVKQLEQHLRDENQARNDMAALEPRLKRVQMILEGPPVRMMRFEMMKPEDPRVAQEYEILQRGRGGAGGGLFGSPGAQ